MQSTTPTTTAERVARFLKDDFSPPESTLMDVQEWDVYSLLSAAFNAFNEMPTLFPGDKAEFALGINALKNIVMARPVMREMAAVYPPTINNVGAFEKTLAPDGAGAWVASPVAVQPETPVAPAPPPDAEQDQIVGIRPLGGYGPEPPVWPNPEQTP